MEGKIFYGHKIVLVTASPRLQSLLSSKVSEGNGTPTVQINDIRYHIFEVSLSLARESGFTKQNDKFIYRCPPQDPNHTCNNQNTNFVFNAFIYQLVMQYLYSGGTHSLELTGNDADVLELMAAASFFQLEGLLRYTEARCAEIIDIDNVVAMYIHAKVRRNKSLC